jgi:hypothetical protein
LLWALFDISLFIQCGLRDTNGIIENPIYAYICIINVGIKQRKQYGNIGSLNSRTMKMQLQRSRIFVKTKENVKECM